MFSNNTPITQKNARMGLGPFGGGAFVTFYIFLLNTMISGDYGFCTMGVQFDNLMEYFVVLTNIEKKYTFYSN